jgi:UDP-glucose 4-epimerase
MNILVTGSSGYIGSNFINTFENKYNFFTFSLQKNSIDTIDFKNIDIVLHCAALVHQKTEYDYKTYHEINVDYPVTLAQKAKKNGVKHFIFISTIAVYGDDIRQLTEDATCHPVTPYGKSKYKAEKSLRALQDDTFFVAVIRPPMVYGKNAPGNIQSLIHLINKAPILPFGKINNRRSFVYIENLVHLIDQIIQQRCSGIFLAADDKPVSTEYLIEVIAKELGLKRYLIKVPFFETLLKQLKPSLYTRLYTDLIVNDKITKERLHFDPPFTFEEGIHLMLHGERQ